MPSRCEYQAVCLRPSCTLRLRNALALCRGPRRISTPPFKRPLPLYPRGPRSKQVMLSRPSTLIDPMRPTRQHIPISPHRLIRNAIALCPNRNTSATSEWFRAFTVRSFSTCRPLRRPRGVHWVHALSSCPKASALRHESTGSELPSIPSSASDGTGISRLHYGSLSLRPVELLAPLADLTRLSPSHRGFYSRASDRVGHPSRRRV
jgi:hypothetical protein